MPIISRGGLLVSMDGWPLTYPAWFSALDRRLINDALDAAAASATLQATPATASGVRVMTGPVQGRLFASEVAAIEALLQVFTVVVRVLAAPRDPEPDDTRRRVADQLMDELVVWIGDLTPAITAYDAFAERVREARETCTWWTAFAAPTSTESLPASLTAPLNDDSPLLTLEEAAAQLGLKSPKTLKAMAKKGEIDIIRVSERKLRVRQSEVNRLLAPNKYRYR